MIVIVVIALVLLASAFANVLLTRRVNDDALVRHERALAALRDLASHPRPVAADLRSEPEPPTDHVRILHEAPASMVSHRRRTTRTGGPGTRPGTRRRAPAAGMPVARPRIVVPVKTFDATDPAPDPAPVAAAPVDTAVAAPSSARHRWPALAGVAAAVTLAVSASAVALTSRHPTKHDARPVQRVVATTVPPALRVAPPTVPARAPAPADVARFAASPTGNGTVTVRVPFTLTLAPSGPCWVRVQTESGQTLFEGTLQAGQHQQVSGSSPLVIRLGNTPAMQLLVNGAQLDLAGAAHTADVRFVPPT
jgi:hypothetical protein